MAGPRGFGLREMIMKTLQRIVLSALLVGLAALSTAVAGSAYAGIAAPRGPVVWANAMLGDEAPHRVYVCRVAHGAVTDCARADAPDAL